MVARPALAGTSAAACRSVMQAPPSDCGNWSSSTPATSRRAGLPLARVTVTVSPALTSCSDARYPRTPFTRLSRLAGGG